VRAGEVTDRAATGASAAEGAEAQSAGTGATGALTEAQGAHSAAETIEQAAARQRWLPGVQPGTAPPLSPIFKIPDELLSPVERAARNAEIEKLRPTVKLPQYDGKTAGLLYTFDGRIVRFKSGSLDPRYISPAGSHAEGKGAIWIDDAGSPGGVLFHNHPQGTCNMCNTNIPTFLPKDAVLWAVPRADAKALTERYFDKPTQYFGNIELPKPNPQLQLPLPPQPSE
jgi:hypothetical protein